MECKLSSSFIISNSSYNSSNFKCSISLCNMFNTHKDMAEPYRNNAKVETFTDSALRLEITTIDEATGEEIIQQAEIITG